MLLQGKVVIVTGASGGIGTAISRVLAREGAAVALNYASRKEKAEKQAAEIRAKDGRAIAVGADVTDPDSYRQMVETVVGEFGRLDGIVNNAIHGRQHGKLDESSLEDYETAFRFGCKAVINSINAARLLFVKQGGGRIVNIVSELWNMAPAEWSVYMAGKGAMVGVSRSLAMELGPENITVNMVAPGWMADERVDTTAEGSKNFARSLPLRRHGSAEEIGKACVFFMSDLASYITGAYVPVAGGRITQMGS